ncbi:MAG: YgjV family protein [Alphaproteobacteria bacterium]|nr:YgjV family protein [Alphaproteobacteria bacterium]
MPVYLIVGNIFSFLASMCTAVSVVKKSKTDFMHWQVGNTVFAILTNVALFSYSGVTTNAVSLVRNVLAYKNKLSFMRTLVICVISVSLGFVFNNRGLIGILPVLSSAGYTLCIYLTKNEQQLRYALIADLSLWATYYLYIRGYPSVITYMVLNIWTAVQIVKNRR